MYVHGMPPICQPPCDIRAHEPRSNAVYGRHEASKAATYFGLTVGLFLAPRGDALIEGIAGHETWREANA